MASVAERAALTGGEITTRKQRRRAVNLMAYRSRARRLRRADDCGPVARDKRHYGTVMGAQQPSDATAGGVWQAWQMANLAPFALHTSAIGFPAGAPFWQPTFVTALAWMAPMWLFGISSARLRLGT